MTSIKELRMRAFALLASIVVSAAALSSAQTFSVIYKFGTKSGDPIAPVGNMVQGEDGALYSTSATGGENNKGTVFKVTSQGHVQVLYSFCSQTNCADGSDPVGLTIRPDGHFIGATGAGGPDGNGTIFDITQTGTLTTLYDFTGGADGGGPGGPPIIGADSSFYGTANSGGASSCGTIYRITNSGAGLGGFQVIHQFDKPHGCNPIATLTLGSDGEFYGTTFGGGTSSLGTAFSVTRNGAYKVLFNFDGGIDGDSPVASLIEGSDGNFYGTASGAVTMFGDVIFKLTPGGDVTNLHQMSNEDGTYLWAGLVQATDGNFYGAAEIGGDGTNGSCDGGCGTLFQLTPATNYTVLHNFDFTDGDQVLTTPFQHTSGLLYGETSEGGITLGSCGGAGCGVFYSWNNSLPPFVALIRYQNVVGTEVGILGQGFTSASTVSFNGTPATAKLVSSTYLTTTVPVGATTGYVTVTTSSGTLTSNQRFVVVP
jgi:uncharacterized repeat protein (TIGR03803 family)